MRFLEIFRQRFQYWRATRRERTLARYGVRDARLIVEADRQRHELALVRATRELSVVRALVRVSTYPHSEG